MSDNVNIGVDFVLPIKALSVNKAWQGRRFKTHEYKVWETQMKAVLPKIGVNLKDKPVVVELEFGFANWASDIDNPIKPTLDVLQKHYDFNDKQVVKLVVEKKIVTKGKEYIAINISIRD